MSKIEEKKYKQSLLEDTPDLWEQIDSKIDGIYETDSSPNMDMAPRASSNTARTKHHVSVYKVAGLIAAVVALVVIPLSINYNNGDRLMKSAKKENSTNNYAFDDYELDNSINGIDSITSNNNSETDSVNNIAPEENSTDTNKNSDDVNNNSTNKGNITNTEACINFIVKGTVHTPDIGLIYYGTVDTTNTDKILTKSTVYVSLRNLSRTELRNQHEIGSAIKVTINDFSYTSSETKPYYATSIIKN